MTTMIGEKRTAALAPDATVSRMLLFTDAASDLGARVFPVDIAPRLVCRLRTRFPDATVASATSLPFATGSVDFVVSSECVEHTDRGRPRAVAGYVPAGGKLRDE